MEMEAGPYLSGGVRGRRAPGAIPRTRSSLSSTRHSFELGIIHYRIGYAVLAAPELAVEEHELLRPWRSTYGCAISRSCRRIFTSELARLRASLIDVGRRRESARASGGLSFANWYARQGQRPRARGATPRWAATARRSSAMAFVWDYSGHFFHFKHPEIEAWLRARNARPAGPHRHEAEREFANRGRDNIDFSVPEEHPPARQGRIRRVASSICSSGRPATDRPQAFGEMAVTGGSARRLPTSFLRPYNEKLYATSLDRLDPDAIGPVSFRHADIADIIANIAAGGSRRWLQRYVQLSRRWRDPVHLRARARTSPRA